MKECKCSSCTCSKNEGKIKVSLERFKNSFQVEFIVLGEKTPTSRERK